MELPPIFLQGMQELLGREYREFLAAYEELPYKGIRWNPLKTTLSVVESAFKGDLKPSPFSPLSYYIKTEKPGEIPLHAAGGFYVQEPSASSAVTVLDPKPGDRVLDLCAAPGGKSTQIAALLMGKGLLWSNEIVKSRANILLSNIERMGVQNAVISSSHPAQLSVRLAGFFHKVLVDAPCSGEGMFRKTPEAISEWSLAHVAACAQRQSAILDCAADCVCEGGVLVYSTCTFSVTENEAVCEAFLQRHPEFALAVPTVAFGREGMGVRIFPMDGGEGHFVAKFTRVLPNDATPELHQLPQSRTDIDKAKQLYKELFFEECPGAIFQQKEKFLILPGGLPVLTGLSVLRAGVELGQLKGNRVEPSHALFACQRAENCRNLVELYGDTRLAKYLHGEEIPCEGKGFTAVTVQGAVLGFGKASAGMLKNRYPKGLRTKY